MSLVIIFLNPAKILIGILTGSALFFCNFWLGNVKVKAFNVFTFDVEAETCGTISQQTNHCIWLVHFDGFYFSNQSPPKAPFKVYSW